jgi:hypothetical protein
MSLVAARNLSASNPPVHVLVVVVGVYLDSSQDLIGAGAFTQKIVDFWKDTQLKFDAHGQVATIDVLASDRNGGVTIAGDRTTIVDLPTRANAARAMRDWADRIAATTKGVGVLHWIGHGKEQLARDGSAIGLACHGPKWPASAVQAAFGWAPAINAVDQLTRGHPVYCFLDACRTRDTTEREPLGLDEIEPVWEELHNAHVFTSTSRLGEAFWIYDPSQNAIDAGLDKGALGTQAFLSALSGFGAHQLNSLPMPILPQSLLASAEAFIMRWAAHQTLVCRKPQLRVGHAGGAILLTDKPMTLVDVLKSAAPQHNCEASEDGLTAVKAETATVPHEFRLARKPHKFRFDSTTWSRDISLPHPYMPISEKDFS